MLFAEVIFAIPCNHKLSQFLKIDLFCPIFGITQRAENILIIIIITVMVMIMVIMVIIITMNFIIIITIRDRIGCTTEEATYQLPLQVKLQPPIPDYIDIVLLLENSGFLT